MAVDGSRVEARDDVVLNDNCETLVRYFEGGLQGGVNPPPPNPLLKKRGNSHVYRPPSPRRVRVHVRYFEGGLQGGVDPFCSLLTHRSAALAIISRGRER